MKYILLLTLLLAGCSKPTLQEVIAKQQAETIERAKVYRIHGDSQTFHCKEYYLRSYGLVEFTDLNGHFVVLCGVFSIVEVKHDEAL